MRVCVVAPSLPPAVGGAEVIADSVIRALVGRGLEVDVVAGTGDAAIRDLMTSAGGQYVAVGRALPADAIPWEFDTFARAQALWEHWKARPPALVHAFSHDAAVSAAIAAPSAPLIVTFNEMATEQSGFGTARSRFVYSLRAITFVTVSSDFYAAVARRHGYPAARVRRVVTGVDVEALRRGAGGRGRTLLGVHGDDRPIVICPSRFTPRKGQVDLIDAVGLMGPDRPLVILLGSPHSGSAAYLEQVRERIGAANVAESVRVLEGVTHQDMPDVYAACDAVVQPSYAEGLGLAALEAMATGRPLVATAVSGFDGFLEHDRNALVIQPGDSRALATELRKVLADGPLRNRLTANALADVRARFDIGQTAREVMAVYDEALRSQQGDAP